MSLGFQETAVPSRSFDPDVVWQVFSQLFARLMAHLPYLILGVLVFVLFLIGARLTKGILITAGRRTRLDLTLADLLGRLASAFTIIVLRVIDSATTAIKLALDEAGIDIPYPHTVVLTGASTTARDGVPQENH